MPNAAPVALKFCLDATTSAMLRHEAAILDRVMSQGRHPGIVELRHTYLGTEPPCLEYEFVAGGELTSLILAWHRAPQLPAPGKPNPIFAQAANVMLDLVETVAFAHRLNPPIVHRDLKPANILVARTDNGRVSLRVADFGIGALASKQAILSTSLRSSRGEFLATALRGSHTPLYASPQQSRGDPPDPRDDVHALGVMWYQMLTGDLTHGRPGGTRWTRRLKEQGMSEELLEVLVDCIEDDPDDRPENAIVLLERLERLVAKKEEKPTLPPPSIPAGDSAPDPVIVPSTGPTTIVVSRLGRGEYTSLAEAVRAAPPGAKILVQSGLYTDGIVLDKPIEIVGDGDLSDIVLQCSDSACVVMQTDYALVKGLTLRCRCASTRKANYAVDVTQGQLVLDGCDITSDTSACVGVHGPLADPILRRSKIHDGNSAGIFFYEGASGTVEDCEISSNRHAAVAISSRSNPTIRSCEIHHGSQVGVHIYEHGKGTIEDCQIHGHTLNGIEIKQGADPTIRRCTINDGVLVWDQGVGVLEDCEITGNSAPEFAVSTAATPTVRRCRIHDSKHGGVLIYENGLGLFEECEIFGNALNGVEIKDGGNPVFRHCRIRHNRYRGIYVHDNSTATVEYCNLTDNAQGGWYITPGCDVQRTGNEE